MCEASSKHPAEQCIQNSLHSQSNMIMHAPNPSSASPLHVWPVQKCPAVVIFFSSEWLYTAQVDWGHLGCETCCTAGACIIKVLHIVCETHGYSPANMSYSVVVRSLP